MHSAKTTNTTLALAISAVLATASSQATSVAPNHTSDSTVSNSSFLLASNEVTEQQQSEAFWNSKYTYDDAALLAEYWGKPDPWYAKLKIGRLLVSGEDAAIQKALQQAGNNPAIQQTRQQQQARAEQQQLEALSNSKYTYDDAEFLAEYWGKSDISDAKLKIGRLLVSGDEAAIQKALQQARQQRQQQSEAFWNSKYTYDDAELLAEYWGKSTWDAKIKIARLLVSGDDAAIQKDLQQAKAEQQQWNAYSNSKYTYDDAAVLAEYWGKSEAWDAKLKIGSLLVSGDEAAIQKALQQAKP